MTQRRPRGYVGTKHETIGSDILAVVKCLRFPEQVLGAEMTRRVVAVDAHAWYPIGTLLELMDVLEARVGRSALFKMGGTLFDLSHKARVLEVAKSARDIIHGLDSMYQHANRGAGIGGWRVTTFTAGRAEMLKNTPHHCVMEEGILTAALAAVNVPARVEQASCFRTGAHECHYVITSAITDRRWGG